MYFRIINTAAAVLCAVNALVSLVVGEWLDAAMFALLCATMVMVGRMTEEAQDGTD